MGELVDGDGEERCVQTLDETEAVVRESLPFWPRQSLEWLGTSDERGVAEFPRARAAKREVLGNQLFALPVGIGPLLLLQREAPEHVVLRGALTGRRRPTRVTAGVEVHRVQRGRIGTP